MASDTAPPSLPRVEASTVLSAVDALLKYKVKSANESFQLLPEEEYIYLNVTLKKIPSETRTTPWRIPLSHPIWGQNSQVCLIIDDRPQSPTPPSEQIKKLVKSQNIPISKVLKISKLKSNYKPYEARRKLCGSYDLFLVDRRVVHLLPKLIGKEFFRKKKLPLGVDLSKKSLKSQVERTLGSGLLYVRTGTCCVMKIGKVDMEKEEIVQNVIDAIAGAVETIPKKWHGVRSLHLKFYDSVALPLYQAMPEMKLKIEGPGEIEKVGDKKVKREKDGNINGYSVKKDDKIKKNKKNKIMIHEINYMDVGEDVEGDDDILNGSVPEINGEQNNTFIESEDEDKADIPKIKKKTKRKVSKEAVVGESVRVKRVKSRSKSTNSDKLEKDGVVGEDVSSSKTCKEKRNSRRLNLRKE